MGNLVILVIEDSQIARKATATQIQNLGLKTDEADNGQDGFVKASEGKAAAIIMDVHMPGMTGIECTRKIREIEKANGLRPVPIIGYTAAADFITIREACLTAGMNECLLKGGQAQQLTEVLEQLVLSGRT